MRESWTPREWILPWFGSALAIGQLVLARPAFFPALFGILLLGWVPLRRSALASPRALAWLLAIPFAAWWVVEVSGGKPVGPVELIAIPAWYFGILSILQVLAGTRSGAWSTWNALVAILLVGFMPDPIQVAVAMAFCVVALLHLRIGGSKTGDRRFRTAWIPAAGVVALVALVPAWLPFQIPRGGFEGRHVDGGSRKGFSSTLRLGDGFGIDPSPSDDDVAVRVWSDDFPGYLKGAVFDTYLHGSWTRSERWGHTASTRNVQEYSVFCQVSDTLEVQQGFALASEGTEGFLLVPSGSGCVGVVADSVRQTGSGVWNLPGTTLERGWMWFPGERSGRVLDAERFVPPLLEPLLDSLSIEAGVVGLPAEAIPPRISGWLSRKFRYSLQVRPSRGDDPVLVFARDREGYCEHFATLGALMARRAGLPARIATGFVSPERSAGAWIFRRSNAHAWVELYDSSRGWRTWDPTPSGNVEQTHTLSRWTRSADALGTRARWLWHQLRDGAWRADLEDRITGATDRAIVFGLPLALLLLVAGVAVWLRRRRRGQGRDGVPEFARRLDRAENRLRRDGHVRIRGETVGQFLERLPAAVDETSRRELQAYQENRWKA